MTTTKELTELADDYAAAVANHYVADSRNEGLREKMAVARQTLLDHIGSLSAEVEQLRTALITANKRRKETLRAQLEAQGEAVATVTDNFATDYSEISRTYQKPIPIGTKLYTHPAPAAPVVEPMYEKIGYQYRRFIETPDDQDGDGPWGMWRTLHPVDMLVWRRREAEGMAQVREVYAALHPTQPKGEQA